MKWVSLVVLLVAAACAPAATAPSATPVPTASPTPVASTAAPTATPATTASPTQIPLPSTVYIAAAGNGVVWAYVAGTHLFRSLDRGATWSERTLPSLINGSIAFVDDRNGWALNTGSAASGCQAQGFDVFRTTDGASTWQKVFTDATAPSSPSAGCKTDIAFVDATHGYITASGSFVRPRILRTVDGGITWTASAALPDAPGIPFDPGVATYSPGPVADFGNVVLVDVLSFQSGTPKHLIYHSSDRGATWVYDSPALQSTRVVFLTPTRWIQIFPQDSRVTADGGRTWAFFAADYQQAAPIDPQIVFGDAMTGYATVRGSIQRTTDGGAHWTGIKTPGT